MALPEVIKNLLESGVHFGHLSKHWNPRMKKFIFGKRKDVYIIDLEKTSQKLQETKEFVKSIIAEGGKVLFVATKKQLRDVIKEQASLCGMPYVVERWVGGLFTNFSIIRSRVKKYVELRERREKGDFEKLPGKEIVRLNRQLKRMERNYSGVTAMEDIPACVYIIDTKKESACVKEANKLSIPIIGLIDTDANPEVIDYPIPGNDDAIKSVKYISSCIVEAINEGFKKAESFKQVEIKADEEEPKEDNENINKKEKKTKSKNKDAVQGQSVEEKTIDKESAEEENSKG